MAEIDDPQAALAEYALGALSPAARREVEALLARTPALRAELDAIERALAGLEAPARPLARVSAALEGAGRFAHLVPALAAHFDVSPDDARRLTEAFEDPTAWSPGPGPGLELMPVVAGPRWAGFLTTMLRMQPGAQLPLHAHAAREQVLVLEGGYRDDQSGLQVWRGETDVREPGTAHSFTALEGPPCLCASVTLLAEAP